MGVGVNVGVGVTVGVEVDVGEGVIVEVGEVEGDGWTISTTVGSGVKSSF